MKTNMKTALLLIGVALLGAGCACHRPPPDGRGGDMMGGPGMSGHRPPSPLMMVLDVNHDGIIDANEIANASEELKALDKNGDGQLTPDELRPPGPPMKGGPESRDDKPGVPPPGSP